MGDLRGIPPPPTWQGTPSNDYTGRLHPIGVLYNRPFAGEGHVKNRANHKDRWYKVVARNEKSMMKLARLPILRLLLLKREIL